MHKTVRIGIQGGKGSTNERACLFFAEKYGWKNLHILYLITTENVLKALQEGTIDYGTFAWKSSRKGVVAETQAAIKKYPYTKMDEVVLPLDHALLAYLPVDTRKKIIIHSHPQALAEHRSFLETRFPHLELAEAIDTALAAEKLSRGEYPENSLVIAPAPCASLYHLDIFLKDLPGNIGYETTLYLAKQYHP